MSSILVHRGAAPVARMPTLTNASHTAAQANASPGSRRRTCRRTKRSPSCMPRSSTAPGASCSTACGPLLTTSMVYFEYLAQHPDADRVFNEAMTGWTHQLVGAMVDTCDLSPFKTVVDVGRLRDTTGAHPEAHWCASTRRPTRSWGKRTSGAPQASRQRTMRCGSSHTSRRVKDCSCKVRRREPTPRGATKHVAATAPAVLAYCSTFS